jgi:ribonuclease HI
VPWRRAIYLRGSDDPRKDEVYAEVSAAGIPLAVRGRVAIRWDEREGARVYRASASKVKLDPDGALIDLPDGVDAESAPATAEAKPKGKGSGFGSAGTRTKAQATAAAEDARGRIASLEPGTIVAYTDGACKGNPGPAGSGAVVVLPDGRRAETALALGRATNNVAELTAIGLALDLLDEANVPPDAPAVVFTDSSYAHGVLTKGWKAKANTELILALRGRLRRRPALVIQWVAGHVGVEGNERADVLANRGVSGLSERTPFPPATR